MEGVYTFLLNIIKIYYHMYDTRIRYVIKNEEYYGKLKDTNTKKGIIYDFKDVIWPSSKWYKEKSLRSRFIFFRGIKQKARWILSTNNNILLANEIINIYRKRMTIEETFKDIKNVERGYAIENIKLSNEDRYDKMLLILSYAYLLLTLFGVIMENKNMHRKIMANTFKYRSISLFQLGLYYFKCYQLEVAAVKSAGKKIVGRGSRGSRARRSFPPRLLPPVDLQLINRIPPR